MFVASVANLLPMRVLPRPARLVAVEAEHVNVYPLEMDSESLVTDSEDEVEVVQPSKKWARQWEANWD